MFSSVFAFWFPWFYVVRVREGITYTSLWRIESMTTVEVARDQVMSQMTQSWNVAGLPSVGRTFHICFLLLIAGLSLTFLQFVCINLMSFFVRRCLYNLRVWSQALRNLYLFLAFSTFTIFGSSMFLFLRIMKDLQVDQVLQYRGMPCLAYSPCYQFIGNNAEASAYLEWGPLIGWCSALAATLFSFLSLLSSLMVRGRLKIRHRRQ